MKQYLVVALFLVLMSINFSSAGIEYYTSTEVIFKQGTAINMEALENLCSKNTCEITDNDLFKLISFKINEQERDVIINLFKYKTDNYYSLIVVDRTENLTIDNFKSDLSKGIYSLGNALIVPGIDEQEVKDIVENAKGFKNLIYFNSPFCGGDGWTTNESARSCEFNGFENGCPKVTCISPCVNTTNCPLTGSEERFEKTDLDSLSYLDLSLSNESKNFANESSSSNSPKQSNSILLYVIFAIILVLVVVLFFFLTRGNKTSGYN